jgi:hypothetical protein
MSRLTLTVELLVPPVEPLVKSLAAPLLARMEDAGAAGAGPIAFLAAWAAPSACR